MVEIAQNNLSRKVRHRAWISTLENRDSKETHERLNQPRLRVAATLVSLKHSLLQSNILEIRQTLKYLKSAYH